jgi:hypothetical protein
MTITDDALDTFWVVLMCILMLWTVPEVIPFLLGLAWLIVVVWGWAFMREAMT